MSVWTPIDVVRDGALEEVIKGGVLEEGATAEAYDGGLIKLSYTRLDCPCFRIA